MAEVCSHSQPLKSFFSGKVKRSRVLSSNGKQSSSPGVVDHVAFDLEHSTVDFAEWLDKATAFLGLSPSHFKTGSINEERVLRQLLKRLEASNDHGVTAEQ